MLPPVEEEVEPALVTATARTQPDGLYSELLDDEEYDIPAFLRRNAE